ncbi:MAG: histidinol-phosphatase [Planctomycetales bacterium]|nr:histidinol-phosphatase [Planctomycetales bacterium]
MSRNELTERLEFAVQIAQEAGRETLSWFRRSSLEVERKGDDSPVTAADRAAEQLLRRQIQATFADDSILGEEFGEIEGSSGYRWVLDPIDGTKSFITGVPLYTTLVAVMRDEAPVLGVIYAPATGEIAYAMSGEQAWYREAQGSLPQAAKVAEIDSLAQATFLTSEVRSFDKERTPGARPVYDQLEAACRLTRSWGDGYGYLLVATGRAHLMIDPRMSLWDAAALQPIIEGAGGMFCDWQGRATPNSGEAIACSPGLTEQVLAVTRSAAERD